MVLLELADVPDEYHLLVFVLVISTLPFCGSHVGVVGVSQDPQALVFVISSLGECGWSQANKESVLVSPLGGAELSEVSHASSFFLFFDAVDLSEAVASQDLFSTSSSQSQLPSRPNICLLSFALDGRVSLCVHLALLFGVGLISPPLSKMPPRSWTLVPDLSALGLDL